MQQGGNRAFIVSHTKHHHHNYHDHNRKDGNDDNRHYHYYHHHPEALVQTMLIGPLGCESRFLEWVNWKYFSNIGERADNIIHKQIWLLPYYAHPQLHDQEHHHHQWEEGVAYQLIPSHQFQHKFLQTWRCPRSWGATTPTTRLAALRVSDW